MNDTQNKVNSREETNGDGKPQSESPPTFRSSIGRRSFLRTSIAVGAGTVGAGWLLADKPRFKRSGGHLDAGDAAILRFLSAAEILETDLWQQYNELGGIQDSA